MRAHVSFFPQQPLWSHLVAELWHTEQQQTDSCGDEATTAVLDVHKHNSCQFEQRGCYFLLLGLHMFPKSSNRQLFVLWAQSGTLSGSTGRQRQNRSMKQRLSLTTLCPLSVTPDPRPLVPPSPFTSFATPSFFSFPFSSLSKVHMNCCCGCSCGCCSECVGDCSTSVTLASEESKNTAHLPFPLLIPHRCNFFFALSLLAEGAENQLSFTLPVCGCACVLMLCCSGSFMG